MIVQNQISKKNFEKRKTILNYRNKFYIGLENFLYLMTIDKFIINISKHCLHVHFSESISCRIFNCFQLLYFHFIFFIFLADPQQKPGSSSNQSSQGVFDGTNGTVVIILLALLVVVITIAVLKRFVQYRIANSRNYFPTCCW